jgi:hypothetical protein
MVDQPATTAPAAPPVDAPPAFVPTTSMIFAIHAMTEDPSL